MRLVTYERSTGFATGSEVGALGDAAMGFEALEPARPGSRRLGALIRSGHHAGWVIDLNRALAIKLAHDDVGAPEVEADSLVPRDMLAFLRLGSTALESARLAFQFAIESLDRYNAPDFLRTGALEPANRVKLCAPLRRPGKIVGVSAAARSEHAAGSRRSAQPRFFLKATSAVIGPEAEIALPANAMRARCEGVLAAVIGTTARDVDESSALDNVAGYCAANDVSCPDLEGESISRSCDSFAPLGPWLVTADEIADPEQLGIRSTLSGRVVQRARAKEVRFSIAQIIAHASAIMALEPGDVVLIGVPCAADSPTTAKRWLREGDLVEVEIDALGALRNHVIRAKRI